MSQAAPLSSTIATEVDKLVAAGTDNLITVVAEGIAKNEIEKRSGALTSAVMTQQRNRAELAKLGPDIVSRNVDGTVASEGYSEGRLAQRKSVQDRIDKLEETINAAVNEKKWDDLLKVTGYNY